MLAARLKYRFNFSKGMISLEDLWDLGFKGLDMVAKNLNKQLKEVDEESFITIPVKANEELQNKFEIVKYIIKTKLAEKEARKNAVVNKEQKQQLMGLIQAKKNEALGNLSIEELEKKMNAL
jgi:hypothetical protein